MIPRPLTESSMPKTGNNDFFLTWYLAQLSSLNLYYYIGKVSRWEIDVTFSFFSRKKKTDISCKLSPWETICTKRQNHYSRKNKKHFKMSSAHILPSIFTHRHKMFSDYRRYINVEYPLGTLWSQKQGIKSEQGFVIDRLYASFSRTCSLLAWIYSDARVYSQIRFHVWTLGLTEPP